MKNKKSQLFLSLLFAINMLRCNVVQESEKKIEFQFLDIKIPLQENIEKIEYSEKKFILTRETESETFHSNFIDKTFTKSSVRFLDISSKKPNSKHYFKLNINMNNSDPKKAKVSEIRFFQNASAFFDDKTSPSFQGVKLNTLIDTFEVDQKATVNVQGFPIVLRREQSIPGPLKDGVIFIEINGWPESMWVDKNGFYED